MSASKTIRTLSRLLCAALLLGPTMAFADYELNLQPGVTEISQILNHLLGLGITDTVIRFRHCTSPLNRLFLSWKKTGSREWTIQKKPNPPSMTNY